MPSPLAERLERALSDLASVGVQLEDAIDLENDARDRRERAMHDVLNENDGLIVPLLRDASAESAIAHRAARAEAERLARLRQELIARIHGLSALLNAETAGRR